MYKIKEENLSALFRKIADMQDLYLPIQEAGQTSFGMWSETAQVDLAACKTVKSPKDLFFPQSETLYTVKTENRKFSIRPEKQEDRAFTVFGIRACDLRGIEILDQVFLEEPADSYYAARRAHGTVVSYACHAPEETCFCSVFGIDCADPQADVTIWKLEDVFYWREVTEKGKTLTDLVKDVLETVSSEEIQCVETEKEQIRNVVTQLPYSTLSLEGWGADTLRETFDSPLWEQLYQPCLACGTCTFLCPTCQCYDIRDYDTGHGVQRYRCWDSCMYSDFTMMAHGNNRTTQMQRFRQRFMHKLVYFPANHNGMYACAGCGRCVEKCPASLNIVKVIKKFAAEKNSETKGARDE